MDERQIVRKGYNQVAPAYLETRRRRSLDASLLQKLVRNLDPGSAVLDAGCGAGEPITAYLAEHFELTAVDFSLVQLRLAKTLVPVARFACQDLSAMGFADNCFDAICSFYTIIHIPRNYHRRVLEQFHKLLVPGGLALLCLGAEDLEADIDRNYFGTEMYWSHYDKATNLHLMKEVGFEELWSGLVSNAACGGGKHLFVLARKGHA